MLTVGQDERIIQMNDACRALVGSSPQTLNALFDELPLRSGHMHGLRGLNGRADVLVAVIDGK